MPITPSPTSPGLTPSSPWPAPSRPTFVKANPDEVCTLDAGFTFEGFLIGADAYKRAGSAKPQALVEALKATNLKERVMIGGAITFDAKGQNVNLPSGVVQIRDGKPIVVLPAESAEMAPVFPVPGWSARA